MKSPTVDVTCNSDPISSISQRHRNPFHLIQKHVEGHTATAKKRQTDRAKPTAQIEIYQANDNTQWAKWALIIMHTFNWKQITSIWQKLHPLDII